MRLILSVLFDLWCYWFWSFVIWCGGPRHDSYSHAVWRRWQAKTRFMRFITGRYDV